MRIRIGGDIQVLFDSLNFQLIAIIKVLRIVFRFLKQFNRNGYNANRWSKTKSLILTWLICSVCNHMCMYFSNDKW